MASICYQINLQRHFGGGEVYTQFLTQALLGLGWQVVLFAHPQAEFWTRLDMGSTRLVAAPDLTAVDAGSPEPGILIAHAPFAGPSWEALIERHHVACFCHMPMRGRAVSGLQRADLVLAVSSYVRETLREHGLHNVHSEPMYGVAALDRSGGMGGDMLDRGDLYDWDHRKVRDRLLAAAYPVWRRWRMPQRFTRREGLTLGIVSRLTTIKQFPRLFGILAPIIANRPRVNLEIFGSGGYASVRDLRRSLAPLGERVRYWGHQNDVVSAYRAVDFVMSGLPELEALGLNLIEAQYCGIPALAVDAPPFTETVKPGSSGYLYRDPRLDGGQNFACLLDRLLADRTYPNPLDDAAHLDRFSVSAFRQRVADVMVRLDTTRRDVPAASA